MDLIELIVGLPTGVFAVYVHTDDARMLLLAQDGQHEIMKTISPPAVYPDRPGVVVVTHRP